MPLKISYVERLEDVIAPAIAFLGRDGDLFARPRIVVPTAGAKAWLTAELARRLGAHDGGRGDGVLANVEFSYPGTISSLLAAPGTPEVDPWDVDHLTFTILEVLAGDGEFQPLVQRAGGPLLAARRIADRFDHYHFRRPGMILAWEQGKATLSPEADARGAAVDRPLATNDYWQFRLWRHVRERIGEPSPPARERDATGHAPDAVLVAGLDGLSLRQIELLEKLAALPGPSRTPCNVEAILVHPSPPLRAAWTADAPPRSSRIAPARHDRLPDAGVDPLVEAWLRNTREAQWLLASQGIEPRHADDVPRQEPPSDAPLLARLKHSVAAGRVPPADAGDAGRDPTDASVLIHRCHDLRRQAEVLHDAILHAFRTVEGLAPQDVVIVSPQIAALAPHLEAVFNRTVKGDEVDGKPAELHLPLLVADRGIREVSPGAELLGALVELLGSRCSVDGLLAVATHPLVTAEFEVDDDAIEIWQRCVAHTKIRWGLDASRRVRSGLDKPELHAHTWRLGLERMLLGATLPDGEPDPVLGGVVPLVGIDAADIEPLSKLISIVGTIDELDRDVAEPRPVGAWCDLLESAIERLAGAENDELAVPLRELDALRQAAATAHGLAPADVAVPWHDLKQILAATLTAPVGRQPLRTGAITATSMIPLRGVPFRVVCLAGVDDEAVAPRESDSENLVERQRLIGDLDPRLEIRRGLLDGLLAAGDSLIVTCTGMDVRNNSVLPLVTPLAEFVDFVRRHGVPLMKREKEEHSAIEIFHPRHACSRRNFVTGAEAVVSGGDAWSHDAAARAVARGLGCEPPARPLVVDDSRMPQSIGLNELAEFMHDPLWPYVRKTLGINPWRDDDLTPPATLPLALEFLDRRALQNDYIESLLTTHDARALKEKWSAAVAANGEVPVLGYGGDVIEEITLFAESLLEVAADEGVPLDEAQAAEEPIVLTLDGATLSGRLERWHPRAAAIVLVRPDAMSSSSGTFQRAKMLAVVQLLAVRARGDDVTRAVILNQHQDWTPGAVTAKGKPMAAAQVRTVKLDPAIDAAVARNLLTELSGLYQRATTRPYAEFDGAGAALANGREAAGEKFARCVAGDDYATSNEIVVHGAQPDFDAVFPDDPVVSAFFARYHALTHLNRQYVYQPR
jgi:exodeoxyribonuclease V gamma subunit